MSVTLLRISSNQPDSFDPSASPTGSISAAIQTLRDVLSQLEPLGRNLASADGALPSWILKRHRTDRETVLQFEAGDDDMGRISYWFEGPQSEQLGQAITALDKVAISVGDASYWLRLEDPA